jgi:hypothetical protein
MSAIGRKRKFNLLEIEQNSVRYTSEADVKLNLVKRSADDPERPFIYSEIDLEFTEYGLYTSYTRRGGNGR